MLIKINDLSYGWEDMEVWINTESIVRAFKNKETYILILSRKNVHVEVSRFDFDRIRRSYDRTEN